MATQMIFKVVSVHTNGINGHLTISAQIIEREGKTETHGLVEDHGIDPLVMETNFGGDGEKWLASVRDKMWVSHIKRKTVYAKAHDWVGKEWPV